VCKLLTYYVPDVKYEAKCYQNCPKESTRPCQLVPSSDVILFIIESYTKYKIDRRQNQKVRKERKQHIQPGYNPTH